MTRPASTNFFLDNDDLRFQVSRVDWGTLVDLQEQLFLDEDRLQSGAEGRAAYEELLTALGVFVANEVAPYEHELDQQHATLQDGEVTEGARMQRVFAGLRELGAFGITLPRRLGGMNAPLLVNQIALELMTRADASVPGQFAFYGGIAQALLFYSNEEGSVVYEGGVPKQSRFDRVIHRIAEGREWGAMVLTEPQAGSDLARLRTKATEQPDGTWRLSGQKIFITAGHGEHHIVIARSEDEATHPGLKGLSLFYVPAHVDAQGKGCPKTAPGARRNLTVGGVEHKVGQRSCVAATIHYEDSVAELLGKRGEGFRLMLVLMNNARIGVAFEALGTCEAAYRVARAYAEERVSMGKPVAQHEMIADYLDEMDVAIRALRATTFEAAFHEESSMRLKLLLRVRPPSNEEERTRLEKKARDSAARSRELTPLIKYFGGEESVRQARLAMQLHGGSGYIVETGVEKLLRDALVIPVYEGTSQIQALMALKDNLLGVLKNPTRFAREIAEARFASLSATDPLDRAVARMKVATLSAVQTILTRIAADKLGTVKGQPVTSWRGLLAGDWDPTQDFSFGLLHAERLTKLLCYSQMAEVLVRQAHACAATADGPERREIAERFVERFEPRSKGVLLEIEASSGSLLARLLGRPKKPAKSGKPTTRQAAE
jgi:hypothetical protein